MSIRTSVSVRISAEGAASTKKDVRGVGEAIVEMSSAVDIASQSWTEFNQALEIGKKALNLVEGAVDALVLKPLGIAAAFETEFAFIKTLGEKLAPDFDKQLKELAAEVGISATEIAKAANNAISSGLKPDIVPEFLKVTSKAAIGGRTELTEATMALVTATNAYKATGLDATRAADVLFATVQKGIVSFEELARSQGSSLGPAAALGVSFEEVNAAVATISQVIPSAAESFTRIDAIIKGITKPTDEAEKAFKRFGIGFGVTNLQAKGLAGVLAEIREKTGGSAEALSQLAGRNKEVLEGLVLLNNDYKGFRDNLDYITKAAGQTDNAFKTIDATTGRTFERLKVEFEEVLSKIGEQMLPLAIDMLEQLRNFMAGPGGKDLIDGLKIIATALMEIAKSAVTAGTRLINEFFGGKSLAALRQYREAMAAAEESTKGVAKATNDVGKAMEAAYDTGAMVRRQETMLAISDAQQKLQLAQMEMTRATWRTMQAESGQEMAFALRDQAAAAKSLDAAQKAGRAALDEVKKNQAAAKLPEWLPPPTAPEPPKDPKGPRAVDNRGDLAAEALYNEFMEQQRALEQIAKDAAAARLGLMADETERTIFEVRQRYAAQIELAKEHGADTRLLERIRDKEIGAALKAQADAQFQAQQAIAERSFSLIASETDREIALLAVRYEAEQRQYADNKTMLSIIDAEYAEKKRALEEAGFQRARIMAAEEMARQARDTSTMAGNVDNALGALKELIGTSQVFEKFQMLARGAKYAADAAGYGADAAGAFAAGNPIAGFGFIAASVAAGAAAIKYGAGAAGLMGGGRGSRGGGAASAARAPTLNRSDMARPARDTRPTEMNVNLFAGDGRPLTRFEAREVMTGLQDLQRIADGRAA